MTYTFPLTNQTVEIITADLYSYSGTDGKFVLHFLGLLHWNIRVYIYNLGKKVRKSHPEIPEISKGKFGVPEERTSTPALIMSLGSSSSHPHCPGTKPILQICSAPLNYKQDWKSLLNVILSETMWTVSASDPFYFIRHKSVND